MDTNRLDGLAPAEDGGPAFPRALHVAATGEFAEAQEGMTLRDYFAAKALQSLVASIYGASNLTVTFLGTESYRIADAMLAARRTA